MSQTAFICFSCQNRHGIKHSFTNGTANLSPGNRRIPFVAEQHFKAHDNALFRIDQSIIRRPYTLGTCSFLPQNQGIYHTIRTSSFIIIHRIRTKDKTFPSLYKKKRKILLDRYGIQYYNKQAVEREGNEMKRFSFPPSKVLQKSS